MDDKSLMDIVRMKKPLRKYLLGFVPKKMIDRRKAGFNPPLDTHINNIGTKNIESIYRKNGLYKFLDEKQVMNLIDKHFDKKSNNTYKLYQLLYLSIWLKNYC